MRYSSTVDVLPTVDLVQPHFKTSKLSLLKSTPESVEMNTFGTCRALNALKFKSVYLSMKEPQKLLSLTDNERTQTFPLWCLTASGDFECMNIVEHTSHKCTIKSGKRGGTNKPTAFQLKTELM